MITDGRQAPEEWKGAFERGRAGQGGNVGASDGVGRAERTVRARVIPFELAVGERSRNSALVGFVVVDGALVREFGLGDVESAELLGPGDLIRPWEVLPRASDRAGVRVRWRALQPTTIAVLDAPFVSEAGQRQPLLLTRLLVRSVWRAQQLAMLQALPRVHPIDDRLVLLFADLVERWGRDAPRGILIPLPLSHAVLARLVGAHRPPVTLALRRLTERGLLERGKAGTWIVHEGTAVERDLLVRRRASKARGAAGARADKDGAGSSVDAGGAGGPVEADAAT